MNKKFLIGSIIAVVLIVGGGVGYYFYNQTSADVFTQSYCSGLTGNSWKNCSQNMATWRKYITTHSNTQFARALNFIENGGNPSNPGPVVSPEPTSAPTGNPFPTITPVPAPTVNPFPTITPVIPCLGTLTSSGCVLTPTPIPLITPTPIPTVTANPTPSASPIIGPVTACQGVTAYVNSGFNGANACFVPGPYINFPINGIPNDQISSFKVEPGYKAVVYQDSDYKGYSLTILAGDNRLSNLATIFMGIGGVWNDQISSMVVSKN